MAVMDYDVLKKLYDIMQAHYPERLGCAIVLNAPWIFNDCCSVIKPWIDENTASKVKFCTDEELATYVNPKIKPTDI